MVRYIQVLLLLLLCGCDLFKVREAEKPVKPPLWNSFYTTWQLSLQNLEYSYEDERNVVKYSEIFTSNFRFYFAQQDINDYGINLTWTRDNERDMLYNLDNWADSIRVDFSEIPDQHDDIDVNVVRLYRNYNLTVWRQGRAQQYAGKMDVQMRLDNGFWRIESWYDYRVSTTPQLPTWGKLKYDFAV